MRLACIIALSQASCFEKPEPPSTGVVAYAGALVGTTSLDTFTINPARGGDALVFHFSCSAVAEPMLALTSSRMMITKLGSAGQPLFWAASFVAIAPDTQSTIVNVSASSSCIDGMITILGDDFTGNDPRGGSDTFDAHAEAAGDGPCGAHVITQHDRDAVWAGCTVSGVLAGPGAGYTLGAADTSGNGAEYKLTTDAAGSDEAISFDSNNMFVISAITIKPS